MLYIFSSSTTIIKIRVYYRVVAEVNPFSTLVVGVSNLQYNSQISLSYFKKMAKGHFIEKKTLLFVLEKVALSHLFEELKQYMATILQIRHFDLKRGKFSHKHQYATYSKNISYPLGLITSDMLFKILGKGGYII